MADLFQILEQLKKELTEYEHIRDVMAAVTGVETNFNWEKVQKSSQETDKNFMKFTKELQSKSMNERAIFGSIKFADEKINYCKIKILALERKILELGLIKPTDFMFLLEKFCDVQISFNRGNNKVILIKPKDIVGTIVVTLGVMPFRLFVMDKNGMRINPVIDRVLSDKMVEFIKYYINMRDMLSADNYYDEHSNFVDTIGFSIVDIYEAFTCDSVSLS